MHESRMMAEVCPSGVCAMLKVSGSRIATPFAPPRPGSTPMMTPSSTPMNISARFFSVSATPKPWISDWISSIVLADPERALERALRQRHEEPDLEDQEQHDAVPDRDRRDLPPGILPEPAHEQRHEKHRRHVDAEPPDQRDERRRGHEHREHELQLADLDEGAVLLRRHERGERDGHRAGAADEDAEVEGEIARLRAFVAPAHAQAQAVEDDDRAQREQHQGDPDLRAAQLERR